MFVKHGLTLLQTMEQLGGELADLREGVGEHIRLGASTGAIIQFLPPLLAQYGQLKPQVRVELQEQVSDGVVAALREGRSDIGIFVEGPDLSGLDAQPFRQDELVLVLPRGHRMASTRQAVAFADALDENWISLTTGAAMLQKQQQAALAAGKPFKLRMQVRSFDTVCHLVAAGLGIAVLPKGASLPIIATMKLSWRPLADAWAQRALLVTTRAGEADPGVLALAAFLAQPSQNTKATRRKK